MNVLMLTGATKGGITNHIVDLGKTMMDLDCSNKVVVGCVDGEIVDVMRENFVTYTFDFYSKNPLKIIRTIFSLYRIIQSEKIDIVHCHYRVNCLYMRIVSLFTKKKFVWTNHLIPISHDLIHRKLTFYGEKAIAISVESQEYIVKKLKIPYEDTRIIYHGINTNKFNLLNKNQGLKKELGIDDTSKVVVLLGRLTPIKGHKFLLDSLRDMDGITIVFTGDGSSEYKKELDRYITSIRPASKVVFTGFVKPSEILSIADVMVLPSQMEGFGISVIESFAMKVPVVRTKTAGYEDTKDFCIGVDYGDINMLKRAVEDALDEQKSKPMVDKAYLKVIYDWNVVEMARNYLDLYKECLLDEKLD